MKNKLIYLTIIITFVISPLLANADGGVIRPLPNGDWTWVDENSQQAFIKYEQGVEKLIVAADIKEENSDIAWIVPVPSKPEGVEIDITSELPIFFGDDVISKAKLSFSENLKTSYYAGLLGQIWTFPFSIIFVSLGGARGGPSGKMTSGDLVSVETHIEKAGMIAEVITAKNSQAIYNYFSQKGFNIKQGSISELNSYIEKDYSFVVSWIASGIASEENRGQRGIFVSFPTPKIYYPLVLTSAYGETEIPITIRVLGHVKPEIFSEIKPYTEVNYFTNRTSGEGFARRAICQTDLAQLRSMLEIYYDHHGSYPSSIQELAKSEYAEQVKILLEDINKYCQSALIYSGGGNDFTIRTMLSQRLFEITPLKSGFVEKGNITISSELQKFYGNEKPYIGEADYTRININSPAKLLKKDLWMENGRPLKISFSTWVTKNSVVVVILLYLLVVGLTSFIAGGLAGLLCFRKFKKYALVGLSNIFTLIGLALIFNYVKKKTGEDIKHSRLGFVSSFSIIFVLLLTFLPIILMFSESKTELWLVGIVASVWAIISIGIFLLVRFLLGKIGLKNKAIRAFLTIVLFIIIWIAIGFLFSLFL